MEKSDEKELARRKGQLEREIASTNEERFRQSSLVSTLQKEIGFLSTRDKQVSLILGPSDEEADGDDVLLEPEGADGFTVIHGGEAKIESISLPSWELRQF